MNISLIREFALCAAVAVSISGSAVRAGSEMPLDARYEDKVKGAWLGKCIGGALGMPIESWKAQDIEKKFGKLTHYTGYFDNAWVGWSGVLAESRVPMDEQWHRIELRLVIPKHDTGNIWYLPIVGMTQEVHKSTTTMELRGIAYSDAAVPPLSNENWAPTNAEIRPDGTAKLDYQPERGRSWLGPKPTAMPKKRLEPGQTLSVTFEARWVSGGDTIGAAFDCLSAKPRTGFGPDDDTTLEVVSLLALEKYGPGLTEQSMGKAWLELAPRVSTTLAEGVAVERLMKGIAPPESGHHEIGEAIGGQMRGEIWGLVCPGRPDLAAEYARRDAVVSHWRNGVYGEQYIAAMISASFTEKDPRKIIQAGLKHIPSDSELSQVIRKVVDRCERGVPPKAIVDELVRKYPAPCNPLYGDTGIVTMALWHGGGHFEKTLTLAACSGQDTDCNSASAAALVGCMIGAKAIPRKWKQPIGDEFRCWVKGHENWKIGELVRRISSAARAVRKYHGSHR